MSGFVHFYRKRDVEYAEWRVSVRRGASVTHERRNLGRVVDHERLIFKRRGAAPHGINADGTPRELTEDELAAIAARGDARGPATLGAEHDPLDFGDAFFVVAYLRRLGLAQVLEVLVEDVADTALCLLVHQVLCPNNGLSAFVVWWKGSYARCLFDEAVLDAQGIRACLEELGRTDVRSRLLGACDESSGDEERQIHAMRAGGADSPAVAGRQALTELAATVRIRLQRDLVTRMPSWPAADASVVLMSLRNHKARVYDHAIVPCVPASENAEVYDAFEIVVPANVTWERNDPRLVLDVGAILGDGLDA